MSMSPTEQRAQEIADRLEGSSYPLYAVLEPGEEDDRDLLQAIDDLVVECDVCGWWVWVDEANAYGQCEDCGDEEDPEANGDL